MQTGTLASVATDPLGDGSPEENSYMAVQLSGTFVATVGFQGTIDGTNWFSVAALPFATLYDPTTAVTQATAVGAFRLDTSGLAGVRLNCSAYTSGTVSWAVQTVVG